MSKIEVNTVEPQCGTTLTLGASGDTVTIPSGATLSASKVSGVQAVSWQTSSIKTAGFTAAAGEGYFCDTSSGAFTVNLPAGSAGAVIAVSDYTRTFQNNNLTVAPNGSEKIGGIAADAILSTEGQTATFVYVDGTEGWINVQETSNSVTGNPFIVATGGTITQCGNCKIHTFTGPGTFCVSQVHPCAANNLVSYMVVAGGASGGYNKAGGGGGAGGFRETKSPVTPYTASPLCGHGTPANRITVTATGFPIAVGAGGSASPGGLARNGCNGSNSSFSTIIAAGGGGGGSTDGSPTNTGSNGGSGGGASGYCGSASASGGSGNTPSVTPPQGNNGGTNSTGAPDYGSGGGGGATAVGVNGASSGSGSGNGGAGATTSISGTPTAYAGGGGGGATPTAPKGSGGSGGGACGGTGGPSTAPAGTANTGGGGGGGGFGPGGLGNQGAGGSGIVIIRYKAQ